MGRSKKKFAAVAAVLIVAIVCALALVSCKKDDESKPELHLAIITDTHVIAENQIGDINSDSFIYLNEGAHKMLHISEAILKSAVDDIISEKPDALFVAGDLTEDGGHLSHRAVAAALEKAKNAGIKVFVIPGNHDIREGRTHTAGGPVPVASTTFDDFKNIYASAGYSDARTMHANSLSYTADINSKYRLIAIDANLYTFTDNRPRSSGESTMEGGLLDWVTSEIKKAKTDGKTPLAMMHFPLNQHMGELMEKSGFLPNSTVGGYEEVRAELVKAGLQYIFTGHMHLQSVVSYEDANGKIYDITSSSLPNDPMPMRHFKVFDEEIEITTKTVKNIKAEYIPSNVSQEERAAILADFPSFGYKYSDPSMANKILRKGDAELILKIMNLLGVDKNAEGAPELAEDINKNFLAPLIHMKLYNKDKVGDELTVEYIAGLYGATIPQTEFKTIIDVGLSYMKGIFAGDGSVDVTSARFTALKYGLFSLFYFIDDYGLLQKMHDIDPAVTVVELKGVTEELFKTGKLPLDELLVFLKDVLKDKISFISNWDRIDGKGLVNLLSMFEWEDLAFGIPLQDYLDTQAGMILFDKLLSDVLEDFFASSGPPANNLKINRTTLEYSAIE